jgi:hypothetical protein
MGGRKDPRWDRLRANVFTYIHHRLEPGTLSATGREIMDAVVPRDHPEYRERPAYRYGLDRLRRRHVINALPDQTGAATTVVFPRSWDELAICGNKHGTAVPGTL